MKVTKKMLQSVAGEINTAMGSEVIKFNTKTTKAILVRDIERAVGAHDSNGASLFELSTDSRDIVDFLDMNYVAPSLIEIVGLHNKVLVDAEEVGKEEEDPKPVKGPKPVKLNGNEKITKVMRGRSKGLRERLDYMETMFDGKHQKDEIIARTKEKFPQIKMSTIEVNLLDGKYPKFNKFSKLIVIDKKTKRVSYK